MNYFTSNDRTISQNSAISFTRLQYFFQFFWWWSSCIVLTWNSKNVIPLSASNYSIKIMLMVFSSSWRTIYTKSWAKVACVWLPTWYGTYKLTTMVWQIFWSDITIELKLGNQFIPISKLLWQVFDFFEPLPPYVIFCFINIDRKLSFLNVLVLKFIYFEKATKFCKISTADLSYVVKFCGLLRICEL